MTGEAETCMLMTADTEIPLVRTGDTELGRMMTSDIKLRMFKIVRNHLLFLLGAFE